MYGVIPSAAVYGVEGRLITIEIDLSPGLPQVHIVGLPDAAVRESIDRVRSAVRNNGWIFPLERITINFAPADLRKEGSSFDLGVAVALLVTSGQLESDSVQDMVVIGELALDGTARPIRGVLSLIDEAKRQGYRRALVPADNADEAALVGGIDIFPISSLADLKTWTTNRPAPYCRPATPFQHSISDWKLQPDSVEDYRDVRGQWHVKRALTVTAAGMHNILLSGPPGTGKTMLIRRLPTIMPPLSDEEALEVSKLYSVSGKWNQPRIGLIRERPFRSPHHSISSAGLIGGGSIPKPGEVSLAHRGILFLDELPEFPRTSLEVLRQPLEDRHVTISRAKAVFRYPAHVVLAASMNPCPCGYDGFTQSSCSCTPARLSQYRSKLSGPLLDRIDVQVTVPRAPLQDWEKPSLSSAEMRSAVLEAQARQAVRYRDLPITFNSELRGKWLQHYCVMTSEAEALLKEVYEQLGLSMRAHDRILKLARTIADIEGCELITTEHTVEAIRYRSLDWNHNGHSARNQSPHKGRRSQ